MINEKFGFLTVIGKSFNNGKGVYKIECLCDCGNKFFATTSKVRSGRTKSCGCKKTTHGLRSSVEYTIWGAIIQRCKNPNNSNYRNYGARGIKVCERWLDFKNFYEDMGARPSNKHSIDRIDNNGDYCPDNCQWETMKHQQSNTRRNKYYTYKGETLTARQWSERIGGGKNIFIQRVEKLGWSIEKAITEPVKRKGKH